MAIQLAKRVGLTVIGTASRPESVAWVKENGADHIINHYEEFIPQLKQFGLETVHYILCLNTTEKHWVSMANTIAPQGKICSIVESEEPLNLNDLKNKSATFVCEFMFTRSMFQTEDMIKQHMLLNEIANLIDHKSIKTTINKRFSPINAENLRKAHSLLESGKSIGKIVLEDF
ncbi:zinc-binding dehydrogenase [Bacillus sp. BRMEA1]|nr:zinc-binding dehydrogenase [Neobacillus endophyticus]